MRPLEGVRIAVTRPADAAPALAEALRAAGAEPVVVPLTRIAPPLDIAPLQEAAAHLDRYSWVVFTSANAVEALASAIGSGEPVRSRIAVVGSGTADAVRRRLGRSPDLVPDDFSAQGLVTALRREGTLRSARILWPRGDRARDVIPQALLDAEALLDDPIAYRTIDEADAARRLAALVEQGAVDVITFTAPSAVACYVGAAGAVEHVVIAVIGAATGAEAERLGMPVHVLPMEHSAAGLVRAIAAHFSS
ncbi:MAG TPA: uroporphyrinogen-III synthase [Longimicrobiales bacterium]